MDSSIKSLGDRIKTFRKRLNLTQKDLAIQMGFNSPETISQIERGDRELKAWELVQLAKLLTTNLNDLLSIEGFRKSLLSSGGSRRKQKRKSKNLNLLSIARTMQC